VSCVTAIGMQGVKLGRMGFVGAGDERCFPRLLRFSREISDCICAMKEEKL